MFSVIHYYGTQNKSRCGYCKQTESTQSHGMHAFSISADIYQDLIDRGWRRSGQYCYKPTNNTTCCPCYTIRCDALEFKLSKSHKKILKRMNRFLSNGQKENDSVNMNKSECDKEEEGEWPSQGPEIPKMTSIDVNIDEIMASEANVSALNKINSDNICSENTSVKTESRKEGRGDDIRRPCKKAKQMRLERRKQKLEAKGIPIPSESTTKTVNVQKNKEKSLREYIEAAPKDGRHKLIVRIIPSKEGVTEEVLELYRKYQLIVHNDPPEKITMSQYQRFLIKSPIQHIKLPDGPEEGYGSFHQQYWLDEKLIAVGVIDILPCCVSSVYFFYDPEYSFLSLGTYGSLREIDFVQRLYENTPAIKYYYMGFYIHSCQKMKYKGQLVPSHLLCPEVYTWHLLTDELRAKLDQNKYQRFNEDPNAKDAFEFTEEDVNYVPILVDKRVITYSSLAQIDTNEELKKDIMEYGELVGNSCTIRMLYAI